MLLAQQQHRSTAASSLKQASLSPNLQQAETFLQQGLFDQVKAKIDEELQQKPSSIQISNAREILNRFKNSNANGILDVSRVEQTLSQAPETSSTGNEPMPMASRQQLLQMALALADRTL